MIIAELRGKLSDDQVNSLERSEDVLTSNVFQCLRYLPPSRGIIPFLNAVLSDCGIKKGLDLSVEWQVDYYFWPVGTKCQREPDVLICLRSNQGNAAFVIEAKYHSGPSPKEGPGDESEEMFGNQLSDEFIDLLRLSYRYPSGDVHIDCRRENCYLLYLTRDFSRPIQELDSAVIQFRQNFPSSKIDIMDHLLWSNWTRIWSVLKGIEFREFPFNLIGADLISLFESKGFIDFSGFAIGEWKPHSLPFYKVIWFHWPELGDSSINLRFFRT